MNKIMLIGNLGSDPEIKYTSEGTPVANFNIATTERWNNQKGEKEKRTEWHRIVAWRKLAELCGEYLTKGSKVYVEGKLQTRTWEDKEGVKRWTTEIIISSMEMLDRLSKPQDNDHTEPESDIPF